MLEELEPSDYQKSLAGADFDFVHLWGETATIADSLRDQAIQAGLSPDQAESFNQLIRRMGIIVNRLVINGVEGKITPEQCIAKLRETMEIVLAPAQK